MEPRKKIWIDDDREERLQIPEQVIGADARMVGPGGEGSEEFAEQQA